MLGTVFQPVTTENLPGQPSILSFFSETGLADQVVLGILLLFSFVSWVIIFAKFIRLRRVSRQSEKFVAFFRKSKRFSEVNTFAGELADTPLTTLFKAGYAELDAQVKANRADDASPTTGSGSITQGKLLIKNISGHRAGPRAGHRRRDVPTDAQHDLPRHDGLGLSVHRPLRHRLGHHAVLPGHRS